MPRTLISVARRRDSQVIRSQILFSDVDSVFCKERSTVAEDELLSNDGSVLLVVVRQSHCKIIIAFGVQVQMEAIKRRT